MLGRLSFAHRISSLAFSVRTKLGMFPKKLMPSESLGSHQIEETFFIVAKELTLELRPKSLQIFASVLGNAWFSLDQTRIDSITVSSVIG